MTPFRMNEILFMIFAMHFIMESPPHDVCGQFQNHLRFTQSPSRSSSEGDGLVAAGVVDCIHISIIAYQIAIASTSIRFVFDLHSPCYRHDISLQLG